MHNALRITKPFLISVIKIRSMNFSKNNLQLNLFCKMLKLLNIACV